MKNLSDTYNRQIPYRINLTGAWLDQPFVSGLHPGSVITFSIEPTFALKEDSGLASSTRKTATEIWNDQLPSGDSHKLAKILFCCDNPPGTKEVTGSLDAIGLVYSGLAKASYDGEYWPHSIEHRQDEALLKFVEELIYLVPIGPRPDDYAPFKDATITKEGVKRLANATEVCWRAILAQDAVAFGESVTDALNAHIAMLPHMINPQVVHEVEKYRDQILGWKVSGAGGGGYLILISQKPITDGIRIVARRGD